MSAYVNIHGQPLELSAKDAVLAVDSDAYARLEKSVWVVRHRDRKKSVWVVRHRDRSEPFEEWHPLIGCGVNEESAWRAAWSRMLADDVAKEARQ